MEIKIFLVTDFPGMNQLASSSSNAVLPFTFLSLGFVLLIFKTEMLFCFLFFIAFLPSFIVISLLFLSFTLSSQFGF